MSKNPHITELLLRGSLITLKRKCGKPNCHCVSGKPHSTPALSYSLEGSTKIITLNPGNVAEVKAGLKRYHKALNDLRKRALAGIKALRKRVGAGRARSGKGRG